MKAFFLVSFVLFVAACSQDSSHSKAPASGQPGDAKPLPGVDGGTVPNDGSTGQTTDDFWNNKKISCSTSYVEMEYYLNTSLRFQADKMVGILDFHSWDNNAPGSSQKGSYTMKCEMKPDPGNKLTMVVCELSPGSGSYPRFFLQRNALDEVQASVYVSGNWTDDDHCSVEKL